MLTWCSPPSQTPFERLKPGSTLVIKLKVPTPTRRKKQKTVAWSFLRLDPTACARHNQVLTMFERPTDLKLRKCKPAGVFVCVDTNVLCVGGQ